MCRDECVLDPEPTCTDECTEMCKEDCDAGISVICQHNCFGECSGSCSANCEGADDLLQCVASCEATCDGECDIQCEPVVDGELLLLIASNAADGSCTAQANMECQEVCQDEEFESCEYELKGECSAACTGDGALFCDGEYVMDGENLSECLNALLERGIDTLDGRLDGPLNAVANCSVAADGNNGSPLWLALLGLGYWRRRNSSKVECSKS